MFSDPFDALLPRAATTPGSLPLSMTSKCRIARLDSEKIILIGEFPCDLANDVSFHTTMVFIPRVSLHSVASGVFLLQDLGALL